MSEERYGAIVIGSGQAAGQLCDELAQSGRRVALVERDHLGGTCVNEGCTPTKTMVASARVAHLARRAADYGVHTGPISIDMARVRQRKREIVSSFGGGFPDGRPSTPGVELLKLKKPLPSVSVRTGAPPPFAMRTPSIGTSPDGVTSYTTPEIVTSAIKNAGPGCAVGVGAVGAVGGADGTVGPGARALSQPDSSAANTNRRNPVSVLFAMRIPLSRKRESAAKT